MYERGDANGGGGGGGDGFVPRAKVALTARQWSAIVMAVSHGAASIQTSPKLPLGIVKQFLHDIADATSELDRQLGFAARKHQ